MSMVGLVLSWLFGIIFLLLAVVSLLAGKFVPAIPLLLIAVLLLPPVRTAMHNLTGKALPGWARGLLVVVLVFAYLAALIAGMMQMKDVYTSPEVKARHLEIYDARLAEWPTPYEDVYVDTSYGKVHVIVSGPEDGPPVLLLNAAAMSGWSWLYNVGALNEQYRTYAIDTIGEVGKSELYDTSRFPVDGKQYADLYVEIAEALGVEKSYVVGASFGGFIGTSYALYYPERVEKLALLGPMGMTPATARTAVRIMIAQFYPLKPIQENTVRWALGDDPFVLAETEEWFRIVLTETAPKEARPVTFTPEQLKTLQVPVLLVIGTKDALTGDPEAVKELALNTPDIQIEVLESGHLIGVEHAERVNELLLTFFGQD